MSRQRRYFADTVSTDRQIHPCRCSIPRRIHERQPSDGICTTTRYGVCYVKGSIAPVQRHYHPDYSGELGRVLQMVSSKTAQSSPSWRSKASSASTSKATSTFESFHTCFVTQSSMSMFHCQLRTSRRPKITTGTPWTTTTTSLVVST